jgi:bifunctional non-homologous end joining protein LigD
VPTRTKLAARDPAFAPMLATLGTPPTDGNAIEWKFDGQRATVLVDDAVTAFSRNGADVSRTFPELAGIAAAVGGRRVVLDGEIVALDAQGRPSFTRLQRRWPQQRRPRPELVREVPCRLMAFDIL